MVHILIKILDDLTCHVLNDELHCDQASSSKPIRTNLLARHIK